jgi:hypothetical protein
MEHPDEQQMNEKHGIFVPAIPTRHRHILLKTGPDRCPGQINIRAAGAPESEVLQPLCLPDATNLPLVESTSQTK